LTGQAPPWPLNDAVQPGGIGNRVMPRDADDGVIEPLQLVGPVTQHGRWEGSPRRGMAGAHKARVLRHGDWKLPKREGAEADQRLRALVSLAGGIVTGIAAHEELPRAYSAEWWLNVLNAVRAAPDETKLRHPRWHDGRRRHRHSSH